MTLVGAHMGAVPLDLLSSLDEETNAGVLPTVAQQSLVTDLSSSDQFQCFLREAEALLATQPLLQTDGPGFAASVATDDLQSQRSPYGSAHSSMMQSPGAQKEEGRKKGKKGKNYLSFFFPVASFFRLHAASSGSRLCTPCVLLLHVTR